MTNRFQFTVGFGSGENGQKWSELIEKLSKRFKNADTTTLIKIAVLTLERVDKKDAITEHELLD